jgi:hypothetical protein
MKNSAIRTSILKFVENHRRPLKIDIRLGARTSGITVARLRENGNKEISEV